MVRTAQGGRQALTSLLENASDFSTEACDIIIKACSDSDVSKHGPALWALMDTEGSPATISGLKLFVYLQYYFCGMVYAKNKVPVGRYLSDADLGYLVAVAAHGVQEGCKVFDNAFAVGDLGLLHALQVTEQQFKDFFYNPKPAFTMANVVSVVQKFLPIWSGHHSAFIAFITPEITSYYLTKQGSGSFFIRFNSSGGISAVLLDAQLQIQSHQFDLSVINTPTALIALLQRSTTLQNFAHLSEEPSLPKAGILTAIKTFANIKEDDVSKEIQKQQGSAVPASNVAAAPPVSGVISKVPAGISSTKSSSKPGNTSLGPKDAPIKATPTASSAPVAAVASETSGKAVTKAAEEKKAPEGKKKEETPTKVSEPEPKEKSGKRASEADNSEKAAKKAKKEEPEDEEDEEDGEDSEDNSSGDDEEDSEDDSVDYDNEDDENYEDDGDSEDEDVEEDDE